MSFSWLSKIGPEVKEGAVYGGEEASEKDLIKPPPSVYPYLAEQTVHEITDL